MLTKIQKKRLIQFLNDDLCKGDITTSLVPIAKAKGILKVNEDCILSGIEECKYLCNIKNVRFKPLKRDGNFLTKNEVVAELYGENRNILQIERTLLNVLGRMSGVATICKRAYDIAGNKTKIYLTRKTMPGLNEFDKKACIHGNVFPHRKNLSEMILLKRNHLIFFSSLGEAIALAKKKIKKVKHKFFEVETTNLSEAIEAAKLGVPWIMLDNFSLEEAKVAIQEIRKISSKIIIECSGGINLNNLENYAYLGPDIISMGCLTKDAKMIDFSIKVIKL